MNSPQKLFVSGSKSISNLSDAAIGLLDDAIKKGVEILVGDGYGTCPIVRRFVEGAEWSSF